MKDAVYKWTELLLKNWAVILPILLFLGSAAGWTFTSIESTEKEQEQKIAIAEKDELTEAMKGTIETLVDYKPRAINQKCNCNAIFSKLIKVHENKHRSEH